MTSKQKQFRAIVLAALMVVSVFAGTIALSGSAAAAGNAEYAGGAVHYTNSGGNAVIEVPFDGDLEDTNVTAENFTLLDDGDVVEGAITGASESATDSGLVILTTDGLVKSNDLELEIDQNVTGASQNQTVDVAFASETASDGQDATAYKGSTVAIEAYNNSSDVEVTATDEDNTYSFVGSTGSNSTVFLFNTENREIGEYEFVVSNETDSFTTYVDVRDLGLEVSVDDQNITDEETLGGTVTANAGGQDIEIELLNSNGDTINSTNESLSGQGEYDYSFDLNTADDGEQVSAGQYTVEVRDKDSGVTAESSQINVEQAGEGQANFDQNIITDERGDVVEIPVTVENTDEANVTIGSEDVGFLAHATVEDGDDDGVVTLLFNTWAAQDGVSTDAFDVEGDEDELVSSNIEVSVSSLLDAGDYDLEVRAEGTSDSQNVATLVLEERSTNNVTTWTASDDTDLSDVDALYEAAENNNLTQDNEIAEGDYIVAQVSASGLGGLYDQNENVFFDSEKVHFSVNQTEAGANRDPFWLNLTADNVEGVIGDTENDTYFVVFTSDSDEIDAIRSVGGTPVDYGADETFTASFTVLEDDGNLSDDDETVETEYDLIEGEHSLDDPYNVSNATGQLVEGDSSVAPGTELRLRVRSADGTSPSFLKTTTAYVTENNTFSAEFDFSEQNVGDEFTVTVRNGAVDEPEEVDGNVVEGSATNETETVTDNGTATVTDEPTETTETATTEVSETTEATATDETETAEPTETDTPGFGVIVALVALVAAALLAVRRD